MLRSNQKSDCEVAVVGAGPYGLSVAAHLRGAKIDTHVLGRPMSFWREHMPKGMKLRSELPATDLGDPTGELTFQAYAEERGITLTYPAPLDDFIGYGKWFQAHVAKDLDTRTVTRIETAGDGFSLRFEDGQRLNAKRVVMATGLENHELRPAQFIGLPHDLVSHSSEHDDLAVFKGKRVAVIGRGQSACESAALLNDEGIEVELISRGDVHWLGFGTPEASQKDLRWRLRQLLATRSGVGPFPLNWPAEFPGLVRRMPLGLRSQFSARCLRPAAASWLRPRVEGVTFTAGRTILGARATGSRVAIEFDNGSAEFDHVLLATGYRIEVPKYAMLAPELAARIRSADGSPLLSAGFQSSVPGLHFVGASSVKSYGPLMRFVAGSSYTARHLTRALAAGRTTPRRTPAGRAAQPMVAQRH